ncbi:MAG: phosphatidate cytidylyltransferase [bacterium]|nr:phosphatidate cytidylyltransferase [bacterium]
MLTRIITSIVAIAVFIAVIICDPIIFEFALAIVALAMLYECNQVITKSNTLRIFSYISGALILMGMIAAPSYAVMLIMLAIGLFMILTVILHGKIDFKEVFGTGLMTLYVSAFMPFIVNLRLEYGIPAMLIVFLSAWGSDTGAFFAGSFLGKHKLIPRVSPKKTVEGSVGGIISAMLCCQVLLFLTTMLGGTVASLSGFSGYVKIGAIGITASVVSQLGDLVASAIKRDCGVKDYGKIFPGHGGFMDRFDSVILIAPLVYYIVSELL